jgi:hypothetical protein
MPFMITGNEASGTEHSSRVISAGAAVVAGFPRLENVPAWMSFGSGGVLSVLLYSLRIPQSV